MSRLIAGTETGLLRVVDAASGSSRVASTSHGQDRERGVCCLAWGGDRRFYCARRNGNIETWEEVSSNLEDDSWEMTEARRPDEARDYAALIHMDNNKVLSCCDDGRIEIWNEKAVAMRLDVEGQVTAADYVHGSEHLVVGGREHELSVWNLETKDREWRARNVPNTTLDLRRPVWPAAARFRSPDTIVLGTKYREIRLYDIRAQRRPVKEATDSADHAIRQLILFNGQDEILFGDVAGDIKQFDLRTMRVIARYPGPAGSVRSLASHPSPKASSPLFAAASLDRHVYLWDSQRRDKLPISSIYCKQRLTALLWIPDDTLLDISIADNQDDSDSMPRTDTSDENSDASDSDSDIGDI